MSIVHTNQAKLKREYFDHDKAMSVMVNLKQNMG